MLLATPSTRVVVTIVAVLAVLAALAATGAISARLGRSRVSVAVTRVVLDGALGLRLTYLVGSLIGGVVGGDSAGSGRLG